MNNRLTRRFRVLAAVSALGLVSGMLTLAAPVPPPRPAVQLVPATATRPRSPHDPSRAADAMSGMAAMPAAADAGAEIAADCPTSAHI